MQTVEDHVRRPIRQDTFDLRDQIQPEDHVHHGQVHNDHSYPSDEEHSVLEDDSDTDERDADYMDDDDGSSSLSIPNESIDFDLVYALHSFAATVEGQANVVKGDSLFLMDDSNSYWWLVRVLKTQEVGYIPAENIETPFERLARLNKHRNVDLASATQAELMEQRERLRDNLSSRAGSNQATPSPTPGARTRSHQAKGVAFTPSLSVHRYPPAVWGDEEEDEEDVEWDDEGYEDEDPDLAEEQEERERTMHLDGQAASVTAGVGAPPMAMEPDDGMSWEDGAVEAIREKPRQQQAAAEAESERARRQHEQVLVQQQQIQQQREQREQQQAQALRKQSSREQLGVVVQEEPAVSVSPTKTMDPAQVTEMRKLSMTPPVARVEEQRQQPGQLQQPSPTSGGPLLPSLFMQQQSDERKRTREEIEALEEAARKKANVNATAGVEKGRNGLVAAAGGRPSGPAKLRKERDSARDSTTDDESGKEKDKKKKGGGVFGGLFGRRKDKDKSKDKGSDSGSGHSPSSETNFSRESEESGRSSVKDNTIALSPPMMEPTSPVTTMARQQQQQQSPFKNGGISSQSVQQQMHQAQQQSQQARSQEDTPQAAIQAQISQHASQLRQRDQQQQLLYQQYLNRSPSTPPEALPSYGLQSASAVLQGSTSFSSTTSSTSGLAVGGSRPRPGSLVLSPGAMDGQGVGLPDLSVVRVFAGSNLQTEATFKTVLLSSSTTASDLVRQAIQRFRLPAEDEKDYYLTIKQVEGSSAALLPHEKPLGVFESLVEAAMEIPKVKRSSVGSISSVASNLSMHPAIKKLSMNDFTDDSAVKFYLNRKSDGRDESFDGEGAEDTLLAESLHDEGSEMSPKGRSQYLTVSPTGANSVMAERFSSPSYRFALQLVIYPDDLPDDMVFDPLTEAIVFKHTLRGRSQSSVTTSPGISQTMRKKVFVFPKNVTVAEVIELGLERFGILEGVVDGGDEIEDKLTKRRSSSRVRYGLAVDVGGKERELSPSSKVIDAYPRPPTYRAVERRFGEGKRRSVDSAQLLLGNPDDVQADDPVFTLRRAIAYRTSSSRHRTSAPLDEIALQHLHRDSTASSSVGSDSTVGPPEDPKPQMSKQAIIAAQRAATRASQRAILSAQANSARGLDVLLPGNVMIRSSRYEVDDRIRYSYVEPDGETYDISDIVEEEWRGEVGPSSPRTNPTGDDLLHGVLARGKDGLGAKLDRVLSKIKHEKGTGRVPVSQSTSGSTIDTITSVRTTSPSDYSTAEGVSGRPESRTTTPTANANGRSSSAAAAAAAASQRVTSPLSRLSSYRTASPGESEALSGSRSVTPGANQRRAMLPHERQSSTSALSDMSAYRTATPTTPPAASFPSATPVKEERSRLVLPKDDFGLSQMMAVIELRASQHKRPEVPPLDPVDELLFGRHLDINTLHPQIKDIYSSTFKALDEMDETLDKLLHHAIPTF
ncbi:hypothetical protein AcV5_000470 [Taiwanofungus camphoratus]|nr:hypothetical protein AcV5_000470 [Antrodia cinnamomea]